MVCNKFDHDNSRCMYRLKAEKVHNANIQPEWCKLKENHNG